MKRSTTFLLAAALACTTLAAFSQTYFGSAGVAVDQGTLYTRSGGVDTAMITSATLLNRVVTAPSPGYRIVTGTSTVTSSATLSTGLSSVVSVVASIGADASSNADRVTAAISGTSVVLKVWMPTDTTHPAPIPSVTATAVSYVAWGT